MVIVQWYSTGYSSQEPWVQFSAFHLPLINSNMSLWEKCLKYTANGHTWHNILQPTRKYVSLCIYQKPAASTRKMKKKIRKRLNPTVNPFFAPNALACFNLSSYLHRQNIIITIVTNEARLQVCCSSSFSFTVFTPARSLYRRQEYKVC